jgi:hypothetical protein
VVGWLLYYRPVVRQGTVRGEQDYVVEEATSPHSGQEAEKRG